MLKPSRLARIAIITLAGVLAASQRCLADSDTCDASSRPATYRPAPGDHADSTSVVAMRRFTGIGDVQINVNRGELHVEHALAGEELRVRISSSNSDVDLPKALRRFDTADGNAAIDVCIAKKDHAVVTVYLPSSAHLKSEINLGAGTLVLRADGVQGDRQVNVGAGEMKVFLAGDHNYASMEANVGFGRLLDHRAGSKSGNSYGVTARTLTGSGTGTIQLNVGAGSLELESGG
jgi:hypothetical protein